MVDKTFILKDNSEEWTGLKDKKGKEIFKDSNDKECLCLNCVYGGQPYGYFPIVCVQGKKSKDMYHEVFKCKHFEACPELPEHPMMKPFNIIINEKI